MTHTLAQGAAKAYNPADDQEIHFQWKSLKESLSTDLKSEQTLKMERWSSLPGGSTTV